MRLFPLTALSFGAGAKRMPPRTVFLSVLLQKPKPLSWPRQVCVFRSSFLSCAVLKQTTMQGTSLLLLYCSLSVLVASHWYSSSKWGSTWAWPSIRKALASVSNRLKSQLAEVREIAFPKRFSSTNLDVRGSKRFGSSAFPLDAPVLRSLSALLVGPGWPVIPIEHQVNASQCHWIVSCDKMPPKHFIA